MSEITDRKKSELRAKHHSLEKDFAYWLGLAGQGLGLHTSQLEGLIGENGALAKLSASLSKDVKDLETMSASRVLSDARALEEMLLAAHCLWGFFREKFAQRLDAQVRDFLDVADELAWGCYVHAMKAAGAKREPPLVFLNGGWSPFMVPRGARWNAEGVPGDLLSDEGFATVLRSLPIPIIGVPYPQVTHLPDVIFVAHEAGHAVEGDFELTALLTTALEKKMAGNPRLAQWLDWMGECFADAWAVAHVGPAYVAALQDFLAPSHARPGDKLYPPTSLRVRLARAFAVRMGFAGEAGALGDAWRKAGLRDDASPYDADRATVAEVLLDTPLAPFGNATAKVVGGYNADQHLAASAQAGRALKGEGIQGNDPRVLFAALRQCYEARPATFHQAEMEPGQPDKVLRDSLRERFLAKLQPTETMRSKRQKESEHASDLRERLQAILQRSP